MNMTCTGRFVITPLIKKYNGNTLSDEQFEFAGLKIGNEKVNRRGFRIVKEKPEVIVRWDLNQEDYDPK